MTLSGVLDFKAPGYVVGQELCKRLGQFGPDDFLVVDKELLEEHLVGLPANVRRCLSVHPLAVGAELERMTEGSSDLLEAQLGGAEPPFGLVDLGGDPLLLFLEEFHRHGAGIVGA